MPNPPRLSPEQREAALEKAAAARRVRAETKDRLKMGLVSFDELLRLADSDELVGKMKTLAALESMPKIGKVKSRRLMTEVGIAEGRRLKGLG
ncbi:MAG: integration host factor, actinobacterial type [Actinomycetota bacterium]|nr:integration host factor, actinobacterial type [Actinomycetota bacterium]